MYVCGRMYVYGDVCMNVGMCVRVMYVCGVYVCVWGCMYLCGGVNICVGVYICVWGCMDVYGDACMCVCVYI
jgi:hypothetical protein